MQAIRKIINSDKIKGIIEMPEHFKNQMVEVIILPTDETDADYSYSHIIEELEISEQQITQSKVQNPGDVITKAREKYDL